MLAARQKAQQKPQTEFKMWREAMQIINGQNDLVELFCPTGKIFAEPSAFYRLCVLGLMGDLEFGLTHRWRFVRRETCGPSSIRSLRIIGNEGITSLRDLALYAFLTEMGIKTLAGFKTVPCLY